MNLYSLIKIMEMSRKIFFIFEIIGEGFFASTETFC